MDKYDTLKLKNQLCFPLYVAGKEVIRKYQPLLKDLDLTYTQFITMMALWEEKEMKVKDLGEMLFLDSGTLTPLLKKLEKKHYITRNKDKSDDRNLIIRITEEGEKLKDRALEVRSKVQGCVNISPEEAKELYRLLYKVLGR